MRKYDLIGPRLKGGMNRASAGALSTPQIGAEQIGAEKASFHCTLQGGRAILRFATPSPARPVTRQNRSQAAFDRLIHSTAATNINM